MMFSSLGGDVPPYIKFPEWFMRNIVSRKFMRKLEKNITLYDSIFYEIVYRAHHVSFKVAYAEFFINLGIRDLPQACGLKRNIWKYVLDESTMKYMYEEHRRSKRTVRRKGLYGDIKWSLPYYLSQAYFWYITVKSFYEVWHKTVVKKKTIGTIVDWNEATTLYIIYDFKNAVLNSNYKCVKRNHIEKWKNFIKLEQTPKQIATEEIINTSNKLFM